MKSYLVFSLIFLCACGSSLKPIKGSDSSSQSSEGISPTPTPPPPTPPTPPPPTPPTPPPPTPPTPPPPTPPTPPPPTPPTLGTAKLLNTSDITYLGFYDDDHNGWDTVYGRTLTHRYVGGQLRFITTDLRGETVELAPPASLGGKVSVTNSWNDIYAGNTSPYWLGDHQGLWWDESHQVLWSTDAVDYPDDANASMPASIFVRKLNSDGSISNLHHVSLEGIPARRTYGGCLGVPAAWQSTWGLSPYVCGWGGYASRMSLGVSLGPTAFGIPYPPNFPNETKIPSVQIQTYMDHSSGTTASDWYSLPQPTTGDRGVRNSDVINYYDGGDTRPNGHCTGCNGTTPTAAPNAGADWLSPAPDGLGRWTWGDSNFNTGMVISTSKYYGFVTAPTFMSGKAWYASSALATERKTYEFQIFNPAHFKEVKDGTRAPWNVKPTSRIVISLPGLGTSGGAGTEFGSVVGATFDSTTNRIYLYGTASTAYGTGASQMVNRIYVFQLK